MSELVKNIRFCSEDPMWDAHAEVPKRLLAKAADRIWKLEAALREIKDQYLSPDQSSAIAKTALAPEQDK